MFLQLKVIFFKTTGYFCIFCCVLTLCKCARCCPWPGSKALGMLKGFDQPSGIYDISLPYQTCLQNAFPVGRVLSREKVGTCYLRTAIQCLSGLVKLVIHFFGSGLMPGSAGAAPWSGLGYLSICTLYPSVWPSPTLPPQPHFILRSSLSFPSYSPSPGLPGSPCS